MQVCFQRKEAFTMCSHTFSYKMDHAERGMAFIINNKSFLPATNMGERIGTDEDYQKMSFLLMELGFEKIRPLNDVTVQEMKDVLHQAAKEDHTNKDCFAVVILSHGEEGCVYGIDDKVPIEDLVAPFKGHKCPSLVGKPKLFFIQACTGQETIRGKTKSDGPKACPPEVMRIPSEADFLIAYSAVPGYLAWTNVLDQGSWFIEALHDVFMEHYKRLDVMQMLLKVNKKVADDYESNANDEYIKRKKQIVCITSTLTKDLLFDNSQ